MKKIISFFIGLVLLLLSIYGYIIMSEREVNMQISAKAVSNISADNPKKELVAEEDKQEKKIRIIAVGDSLTAGYGLNISQSYPAQLEKKLLAEGHKVEVINAGISGETTAGLLERVEFIKSQKPDIVLITTGGNDALRAVDLNSTEKNIRSILQSLKTEISSEKIFLMNIKAPLNLGLSYAAKFNNIFKNVSKTEGVKLLPFVEEEVYLKSELMLQDGIHPNMDGYNFIIEKYLLKEISEVL